jgi:hypothetical protein
MISVSIDDICVHQADIAFDAAMSSEAVLASEDQVHKVPHL